MQVGAGTVIGPHVHLSGWTEIGVECQLHTGASLGGPPQDLGYDGDVRYLRVGDRNTFREYTVLHRGAKSDATVIGDDNYFMAYSHVGHDCRIGNQVIVANATQLAGHVEVGDRANISGGVVIHQFCRVGRMAMVSGLSATSQDIPPFVTAGGRRCVVQGLNTIGLRRGGLSSDARASLAAAFEVLFRSTLTPKEAADRIEAELEPSAEVTELIAFVRSSHRGICPGREAAVRKGWSV